MTLRAVKRILCAMDRQALLNEAARHRLAADAHLRAAELQATCGYEPQSEALRRAAFAEAAQAELLERAAAGRRAA